MKKLLLFLYKLLVNIRIGAIFGKLLDRRKTSKLKWLIYNWLMPRRGVFELKVEGKLLHVNAQDMGLTRQLFLTGAWEKYETELFKSFVSQGMVVIDIGALYGQYSIIASDLVGHNGGVYAFEPVPNQFNLLVKNIEDNDCKNVKPLNMAISDKCGISEVWVDIYNISSASLEKDNVVPTDKNPENISKKESCIIETITLDSFVENERIGNRELLIKMDVGGSEGRVISGARKLLHNNNNITIFMEYWPKGLRMAGTDPIGLLGTLRDYGFKIFIIDVFAKQTRLIDSIEDYFGPISPDDELNLVLQK